MSAPAPSEARPVTAPQLLARKRRGERLTMLTAYDTPTARILDGAGIDVVLVGDSLGMVVLGRDTTLPVTMDEMIHHTAAVSRGVRRALVVGDMPFLSYQASPADAVRNAGRFLKEGGAAAVKIEGGRRRLPAIRAVLDADIPVMGHLGLTPQSFHRMGGYRVQGRTIEAVHELLEDARALAGAGVFSLVLEGIPAEAARAVTREVPCPTFGIGAGPDCDGQVLVLHDLLGLTPGPPPRFVRRYADLTAEIRTAVLRFADDVRRGEFPSAAETYPSPVGLAEEIRERLGC
jgi:3-methyl-2-oxobutanoate hydroxymethyltransferase